MKCRAHWEVCVAGLLSLLVVSSCSQQAASDPATESGGAGDGGQTGRAGSGGHDAGGASGVGGAAGTAAANAGSAGSVGGATGNAGHGGDSGGGGGGATGGQSSDHDAGAVTSDANHASSCAGIFCEDFENAASATPSAPWTKSISLPGATVTIDDTKPHAGQKGLHIKAPVGEGEAWLTLALPTFIAKKTQQVLYARAMVWMANTPGGDGHWDVIGAAGVATGTAGKFFSTVTYGGFGDSTAKLLYYALPVTQGAQIDDCSKQTTPIMPQQAWTCVTFKIDVAAAKSYGVAINGQDIPTFAVTPSSPDSQCVQNGTSGQWYVPDPNVFYVGFRQVHPSTKATELWIDDIELDTKTVSCPAK